MITVTKTFRFEAAHFLPDYSGACKNVHGHGFKLQVTVSGILDKEVYPSMVCDFKDIKKIVKEHVIDKLDHSMLNDVLEYPTAENMICWIELQLVPYFGDHLVRIRLYETEDSYAEWSKG